MASERRSSISSLKSAISRTSMGSGRPSTPPSTAERRPPSPLTQPIGVPTLAPPPAVGTGGLPPPMTPQRKAIQRQKSPLSAEAFSSPTTSMPGSFPDEGPAVDPTETTPQNQKRMSTMSKFLPFKALRHSSDASSPQSSAPNSPALGIDTNIRPGTSGGDSIASSPKPSLRKRVSGQFFRRKSSLNNTDFVPGVNGHSNDSQQSSDHPLAIATPTSPRMNGFSEHETIQEDPRPSSPTLADSSPISKKRKSSTFWRRTSSLTLTQTLNTDRSQFRQVSAGAQPTNGHFSPSEIKSTLQNGNGKINGHAKEETAVPFSNTGTNLDRNLSNGNHIERKPSNTSTKLGRKPSIPSSIVGRRISGKKPQPMLTPPRSASPPPQLPPFVGGGDGLGLDDWFL